MYKISNDNGLFVLSPGATPREALINMLKATCHPYGIVMEMEYYPDCWMIQNGWVLRVEKVNEEVALQSL